MEEDEPREPLTFDEIEALAAESSQSLHDQTGLMLPRLAMIPLLSERRARCVSLGIDLPLGSLFYPCCGSDIADAVKFFGACVTECRFADPYRPPRGRASNRDSWQRLSVPHIETVVVGPHEHWSIRHPVCVVYSYRKDGLLTLIEDVLDLSVFYYRGDGYDGEGGSNQLWLWPVLFHTVLARLLDGGIIATDGANCGGGHDDRYVPWSPLCRRADTGTEFEYASRAFLCVGELKLSGGRNVCVWRVAAGDANVRPASIDA